MSPTYQPSSLRDLRTHSNTGIVLDDTVRGGGSDARYLRQIKNEQRQSATGFRGRRMDVWNGINRWNRSVDEL